MIRAVAAATPEERAFWERCISKNRAEPGDLETAQGLLAKHGTLETTRQDAINWAEMAKDALTDLPAHPIRDMLRDLADYVVARVS